MTRFIYGWTFAAILSLTLVACGKKNETNANEAKANETTPVKPPYVSANPAPASYQGVREDATRKIEKSATLQVHLEKFLRMKGYDHKKYNLNTVILKDQKNKRVVQVAAEGGRWDKAKGGHLLNEASSIVMNLELVSYRASDLIFGSTMASFINANLPVGEVYLDGVPVGSYYEYKEYVVISDLCSSNGSHAIDDVYYNDNCKLQDPTNGTFVKESISVFAEQDRRQNKDIRDLRAQLNQLRGQVNANHQEAMKEVTSLQAQLNTNDAEIGILFDNIDDLEAIDAKLKDRLDQLKKDLTTVQGQVKEDHDKLVAIEDPKSGELTKIKARVANAGERINAIKKEIRAMNKASGKLEKRLEDLEESVSKAKDKAKRVTERLTALTNKVDAQAKALGTANREIEKIREELKTAGNDLAKANEALSRAAKQSDVDAVEESLRKLEDRVKALE